jgi:hypothetical protein
MALFANLLTHWGRALHEKLVVAHQVKKFILERLTSVPSSASRAIYASEKCFGKNLQKRIEHKLNREVAFMPSML